MVWVIQQLNGNTWESARHSDGMPMMFTTRKGASLIMAMLATHGGQYRILQVRD